MTEAAEEFFLGQNPLLAAALFYLVLVLAIGVHEIGHFAAAKALALPTRLVAIGSGPLLAGGRIGETRAELRLLPLTGFVRLYPPGIVRKYPMMLFVLGGALGNAAATGLLIWLSRSAPLSDSAEDWVSLGIIIHGTLAFGTLLPMTSFRSRMPSDGLLLLRLLRTARRTATPAGLAYASRLSVYSGNADQQSSESQASTRIAFQFGRASGSTAKALRHEVLEALQRELARRGLPREEELLVLDALIGACLLLEEPGLVGRLDTWSLRALEIGSNLETIRGSRGAALVVLGRHEEGRALLAPLADTAASPFDAFMSRIFLARAELRLGHVEAARKAAGVAHATAASWSLPADIAAMLARMDAEIAHASAPPLAQAEARAQTAER